MEPQDGRRGKLAPLLERFRDCSGYTAWRKRLAARGLSHLHFVFLRAEPADEPGFRTLEPRAEVAHCHAVADAWL